MVMVATLTMVVALTTTMMMTEVCWHCRRVRATGGGISLAGDGSIGPACVRTMRANIADAVLAPAAAADEGIGNTDGSGYLSEVRKILFWMQWRRFLTQQQ